MMSNKKKPTSVGISLTEPTSVRPSRPSHTCITENFQFIWLNESFNKVNNNDYLNFKTKLRQLENSISTFVDVDECIDFISATKEEKVFMISSCTLGQTAVPAIHDMAQVSAI